MTSAYTLLVLGGTSALATAYARRRLARLRRQDVRVILAGRSEEKLEAAAADLRARGAEVDICILDLAQFDAAQVAAADQPVDEAILAYGALTDQSQAEMDPAYLGAQLALNFTSAVQWLAWLAAKYEGQGHGKALVLGSVAGDRGRRSNHAYGAAKAGLAAYVAGLCHRFAASKTISFTLLKPGFVDTPMTAHIQPKGALWARADQVARRGEAALLAGRAVAYAPRFWGGIMQIVKITPNFIFHRTKF